MAKNDLVSAQNSLANAQQKKTYLESLVRNEFSILNKKCESYVRGMSNEREDVSKAF